MTKPRQIWVLEVVIGGSKIAVLRQVRVYRWAMRSEVVPNSANVTVRVASPNASDELLEMIVIHDLAEVSVIVPYVLFHVQVDIIVEMRQ
jgi:hypothetical protein